MYSCSERSDLLLDFLYGLLEPEEVQRLRAHLADCPACRAALAEAEAQQRLLARAAHIVREVPAFVLPGETELADKSTPSSPESATAGPSPLEAPAVPLPQRHERRLWRWAWLATAAALFLVAGRVYWSYQEGLARHQADLAQAQREVEAVDARLASSTRVYEEQLAQVPAQVSARELRLQVAGPALYRADAPSQVQIVTRDARGLPAPADLDVTVTDATGNKAFFEQQVKTSGATAVVLPAALPVQPGTAVQLVVKAATGGGGAARLSEVLSTTGASYDTHVVLNKPAYRPGETLSFRTLTLDRFSQKPPGRELRLTFTLRDGRNAVRQLQGNTRPDGVAGGEFPLGGLPPGTDYSLEVASPAPAKEGRVLPRSARFIILHDGMQFFGNVARNGAPTNQVNFRRELYAPGDTVEGEFRQTQNTPTGQTIRLKARQGNGQSIPLEGAPPGKPLETVTNAEGRAPFYLRLPRDMGPGRPVVEAELKDGVNNARIEQEIPVAPAYPEVEFFPEGGDLTAGVPNRVYFRAQTPQGVPIDIQGQVVNREGKTVATVKSQRDNPPALRGLGSFAFTPQAGESYTFQIDVAAQTKKVVPMPAVHRTGIALGVANSVGPEGEPISAVVRTSEPVPQLLALAACRGHVVDQQFFSAAGKETTVKLNPVPGTRGIVRLTIYEVRPGELLPRAERLVYRIPAERLILSCATGDKKSYQPGEHVQFDVQVKDEKGQPARATLLAAARNASALPANQPEQGPPAFFYLTSEVADGADLENADFLVSDAPQARAALDLFLGTQGWRRFAAPDAVAQLDQSLALAKLTADTPAVFNRDNSHEVAVRSAQFLAAGQDEVRRKAVQNRATLQEDREHGVQVVRAAAAALAEYEQLAPRVTRLAVGVLFLLLLAVGGILLVVGFVRVLRGRRPTVAFATAFGALVLCLVLYGVNSKWHEDGGRHDEGGWALAAKRSPPQPLPEISMSRPESPEAETVRRPMPVGRFQETPPQQPSTALNTADTAGRARDRMLLRENVQGAGREQLPQRVLKDQEQALKRTGDELMRKAVGPASTGAYGGGQSRSGGATPPPAPVGAAPATRGARTAQEKSDAPNLNSPQAPGGAPGPASPAQAPATLALRAYAFRNAAAPAARAPDILLWYPDLVAGGGSARIAFDVPNEPATYQLLLYASSPSGRLGAYHGQIIAGKEINYMASPSGGTP
jgi:Putative zinc-finger